MFTGATALVETSTEAYCPEFFAYRKLYGDPPPEIHTFPGLGQLWGLQQDIIKIATGRTGFVHSLEQLKKKLKSEGIYIQNMTAEELSQMGVEGVCLSPLSTRKTGEYILKIATPEQYARAFGLDPHTAYLTALKNLGHEIGHAYDQIVIPRFVKMPKLGLWDSEVRQWRFTLAFAQAVGKSDWKNQAKTLLSDIQRFGSKIV